MIAKSFEDTSISGAWLVALRHIVETPGLTSFSPLTVTINIIPGQGIENTNVRSTLDDYLLANGFVSCHTTANTLFPTSLWNPNRARTDLYRRYEYILPILRKCPQNRYGTYFQRLIGYRFRESDNTETDPINQLEHIIGTYLGNNHRRSALQAMIFDPSRDHTNQRQRGFPCLQSVFFTPLSNRSLSITGIYATQHIVRRAYGNYLGLYRLGLFMAHEMGLTLSQVRCVALYANLGVPKGSGKNLFSTIGE
jgi:hypothetical protein